MKSAIKSLHHKRLSGRYIHGESLHFENADSVGTGDGLETCETPSLASDDGFRCCPLLSMSGSNSGCRRACLFRWSLRMKRFMQIGQTNLFSPENEITLDIKTRSNIYFKTAFRNVIEYKNIHGKCINSETKKLQYTR